MAIQITNLYRDIIHQTLRRYSGKSSTHNTAEKSAQITATGAPSNPGRKQRGTG